MSGLPTESRGASDDPRLTALMCAAGARPAWATLAALTLAALVARAIGGVSLPLWVRYLPLAVSLVVFGLPHGAVDHLAVPRAIDRQATPRWLLGVGALYLLLGGAYAWLWVVAPVPSALFFVALTWFHWGQGDLYALSLFGGDHLENRWVRAGTLLVRGGLPMLVPLLSFPGRYRAVLDAWVALFGRAFEAAWLTAPGTRLGLGLAFAGLTVGTLTVGRLHAGPGRAWRRDAAETLLLWAYFLAVPPLVAVGVYFCVWHATRHVVRLVGVDEGARATLTRDGPVAALLHTGREAVPLTALSVLLLVGFGVAVGASAAVAELGALYLVFIAVLTLPHVAVVTWMDWAAATERTVKG